jgi:exodeoxyribonuclease V alpha subunit
MAADGRPLKIDVDKLLDALEKEVDITYEKRQRDTIALAAERRLLVITGGPGTGKTTCLRAIDAMLERAGIHTVLTAPTGRAAKRMSEITGREAQTVHRLLEAGYNAQTDETVFKRSASDLLDCGAVILDECSMVDITLFAALLDAMPADCRLIMVGDADQLPSVGPGNVFSDIIRSGAAEVVRLTEIFRQTGASRIVENAHMINRGEHLRVRENGGDFFFLKRAEQSRAAETIEELCAKRLPENMGIPARDIQVLSPTRRSETGTKNLNKRLQAALNPPGKEKKERKFGEITFREGDKVMQIRNNYDIIWEKTSTGETGAGIFNGDVGFITRVDEDAGVICVEFDDRVCAYGADMLTELEHAFAMTVHKSQGSEYRAVVLAATKGPEPLLSRGVLYTAVTRARELLVIVGDDAVLDTMIDNYRQVRRYSGLRARLAKQAAADG